MGQPTKILLIDIHPVVRAGLRSMLRTDGAFEIVGEADGIEDAIRVLDGAVPDVLITDANLIAGGHGERLRAIKAVSPNLRILALSGAADSRSVADSFAAGAVGYVTKDCLAEELSLAVRTIIDRKVYLSPRVAGLLVDHFRGMTAAEPPARPAVTLTPRQQQVVRMVAEGLTSRQIAAELALSVRTVDALRQQVMEKLGIRTVAELTKYAIREGLTVLDS